MTGMVNIESDYQYVLGNAVGNVLNLEAVFQEGEWTRDELFIIKRELEETAKTFAERQGLGMSFAVESINGTQFSIVNYHKTGNLINSIHADIENNRIHFYNNAQNSRGQYYAGHIEYGFHDRSGKFVPARPFMRPALYAVSQSSRGHLAGSLKNFLQTALNQGMGYQQLQFGHMYTGAGNLRRFYENQAHIGRGAGSTGYYTSKGLRNTSMNASKNMNLMRNSIMRSSLSTNRRTGVGQHHFINTHKSRDPISKSTQRFGKKGVGRPAERKIKYSYKPSTAKRGRPATGQKPRPRSTRGPGRPRNGQPSRRPTGNKRGRPPKNGNKKEKNPYNHRTIKRDIKPSATAKKYAEDMKKAGDVVKMYGKDATIRGLSKGSGSGKSSGSKKGEEKIKDGPQKSTWRRPSFGEFLGSSGRRR